jgi:pyridoxine 4-dehydrogenase
MTDRATPAARSGGWTLGDRQVWRVGFGAMRLTGSAAFSLGTPSDRAQAISAVRTAVELGVNHIDTAAFYFSQLRSANELLNTALSPYPADLVIATKVGPSRDSTGRWLPPATPEDLRGQVEENLRQLGKDDLDLVYLRVQSTGTVGEHVAALVELQQAGLVRQLGLSGVTVQQIEEALEVAAVVSVQNRFGLGAGAGAERDVLDLCTRRGIAFVPFFAIAGKGADRGARAEGSPAVLAVAEAHGASPAQIRLAWTLHQGPNVLAIPGSGNPEHVRANVAAGALRLSDADLAQLSQA